jgi:hypothetical protein
MKVNIVGCGPTGMTVAWELSKLDDIEIHIYDKKPGPGGSWWEPDDKRDLHAPKVLFNRCYVNFATLLKEMGIKWSDLFGKMPETPFDTSLIKKLTFGDYLNLTLLTIKVFALPDRYRAMSLHAAVGDMSPDGQKLISTLPFIMDGVSWDVMTAYEFVMAADWIGLSNMEGQKVSGAIMSRQMESALKEKGVHFHFNQDATKVNYGELYHDVRFANSDETVTGDFLVLAVDHGPARRLIGDNWGPGAHKILRDTQYQCVTLLLEYDEKVELKSEITYAVKSPWNIIVSQLEDGKTVSVVLCDLKTESPYTGLSVSDTPAEDLIDEVRRQTGIPNAPHRICWGSEWINNRWVHYQTSGVLSKEGQIPFIGKCPQVALCGMMSPRDIPFASIEAAVEVGKRFTRDHFGVGEVRRPLMLTRLFVILLIVILILKFIKR